MKNERDENEQREISLGDVRAPQTLGEQRMTLKKSDDRVDQIGEQDGEAENDDDRARSVDKSHGEPKQKNGPQYITHLPAKELASYSLCVSSFCLMDMRARSSEERVLSTATFRTMPPLR